MEVPRLERFSRHIYHNENFEHSIIGGDGHDFMFLHDESDDGINKNCWLLDNHSICTILFNKNPCTNIREAYHSITIHSNGYDSTTNLFGDLKNYLNPV